MGNAVIGAFRGPYPNARNRLKPGKFLLKNYEVIPLVVLMVTDVLYATSSLIYHYNTRDIVIDRSKKPVNERMDLLNPYFIRLIVIPNQYMEPACDLHDAYKAMHEKEKQKGKGR